MAEPPLVRTFVNLMAIEALSEGKDESVKRYMSKSPSFNPGGGSAYGGHVFAQAVCAASQDVWEGMVVHMYGPLAIVTLMPTRFLLLDVQKELGQGQIEDQNG